MSNHCIDVGCTVCGRIWCVRCGDWPEKAPEGGVKESYRIQHALQERTNLSHLDNTCCNTRVVML